MSDLYFFYYKTLRLNCDLVSSEKEAVLIKTIASDSCKSYSKNTYEIFFPKS